MRKKVAKLLTAVLTMAMAIVMGVALTACGDSSKGGTYSIKLDGGMENWDYCFVHINAFGDEAGVGMLNIDNWGNKKLELGDDGTCAGTGSVWTITLKVDGEDYELVLSSHIKGDGVSYSGEGDFAYTFTGKSTAVDGGYKLAKPTYVKVALTGGFTRLTDGSDFADYIPSAPVSFDSNTADDADSVMSFKQKILPSKLVDTVFCGATFKVSGEKISSVTDIEWYEA